jgi:hypothetical protein
MKSVPKIRGWRGMCLCFMNKLESICFSLLLVGFSGITVEIVFLVQKMG